MAHTVYNMEDLENMKHELNWSGTVGYNIHGQKQLVEDAMELHYENQRLRELLSRMLKQFASKDSDETKFPAEDLINEVKAFIE